MKSIIRGMRYDTEAPQTVCIGHEDALGNGAESVTDFAYWKAGLYKTGGGRYFLAGHGGPMTRFARHNGNTREGDSKVIPLTVEEAQEWAERYLDAETVEQYFDVEDA